MIRHILMDGGDVGFALLDGIETGQVGEGVEVDRAVEPVRPDLAQQLDRLDRVDGADHQPVVALGIAIIEVDAEQAAVPGDQRRGEGGLLVGVEHMGEVERHPEIWAGRPPCNASSVVAASGIRL